MACGGDATPGDAGTAADVTVPQERAAQAQVRFEVTGGGAWLVTRGRSCRTFEIEREVAAGQFERVALDLGNPAPCEVMMPGAPASIELRPLSTTATPVTWDGRQMAYVRRPLDCSTRSFTGSGTITEFLGALQPLPAGRYRVSFAMLSTVPRGCMELMNGYWCPPDNMVGAPAPGPYALCPGDRLSATFELPASGSVTVAVTR